MMKNCFNIIIIILLSSSLVNSQEVLIGLNGNPDLQKNHRSYLKKANMKISRGDTLNLPFFDDFALLTVYPDQSKWMDKHAYINNQWAMKPMSYGVASLDIADSAGVIRSLSTAGGVSDYLTSRPLDLSYSKSDSIYLSFAYQAGGRGKEPEEHDSLVLEVRTPDTTWHSLWNKKGGYSDSLFSYVMIPLHDQYLLKKGFQFRFKNYGSVVANSPEPSFNSNNDIWNIDYVWIDTSRTINDTLIEDVAFTDNFSSLLKGYEAVPWQHFLKSPGKLMKDSVTFQYRNNGGIVLQVDRQVFISELTGNAVDISITNDNENINPLSLLEYTRPLPDGFLYDSSLEDSVRFELKGVLKTDTVSSRKKFRWNDTVYYYQDFSNYYAYDDGLPEVGYGIGGQGTSSASLAYKIDLLRPDTLRGVEIYFNRTLNNENQQYFYLTVWDDNEGEPGDTLFQKTGVKPSFKDSLFEYTYYSLDTAVYVEDTFHIGWVKTTDDMLNVGFDLNNDASEHLKINIDGSWKSSSMAGAVMLRPVFSKEKIISVPDAENRNDVFTIFPNPASSMIRINGKQVKSHYFTIYSLSGRKVRAGKIKKTIDVSALEQGMYVLMIRKDNHIISRKKLIINR